MKYIKLFMLLFAMSAFVACSDDDNDVNTTECTVGFESTSVTVNEAVSSGLVDIPITVSGRRNGPVKVTIEAAPTGDNPAIEDVHYMITDKTLNLNADTLSTGTINVEVKIIDDTEINENRQFTLTIASAEGAEITTQQTTVTIRDNDANYYEAFAGTWTLTAYSLVDEANFSTNVTISAAEEGTSDYDKYLTLNATNIFGGGETDEIRLAYTFDSDTQSGTLAFVSGETIGTYSSYDLVLYPSDGSYYNESNYSTVWQLTEESKLPDTITFDPSLMQNYGLGCFAVSGGSIAGYFDIITNIVLTRQ